jgi:RHS repeat-associated protein
MQTTAYELDTLHVMDGKQRVALVETDVVDSNAAAVGTQTVRYQLGNHLQSSVLELDGAAAILSYEEYYPFGSTAFQYYGTGVPISAKRYRYTGMERDDDTGLEYHGSRYYAPWLARWISCDPAGMVDGPDLFVYARNVPITKVDYGGHESGVAQLLEGAGQGATQVREALESYAKDTFKAASAMVDRGPAAMYQQMVDTTKAALHSALDAGGKALDKAKAGDTGAALNELTSLVPTSKVDNAIVSNAASAATAFRRGDRREFARGAIVAFGLLAVAVVMSPSEDKSAEGAEPSPSEGGPQAEDATAAQQPLTPSSGAADAAGFSTAARAGQLADAIPAAQAGRITMGVGLAEDATGAQRVLIGTSEPGGYLRPGVTLAEGETMAPGTGHAEEDIVNLAQQNGLRLLEVGATRPICPPCAKLIEQAGATPVTPLKVVP